MPANHPTNKPPQQTTASQKAASTSLADGESNSTNDLSQPTPPPCIPGFETIRRYWDQNQGSFVAKVLPGEFYVSAHDELICTLLGSCVSACIRDRRSGLGGLNHFLLPLDPQPDDKREPVTGRYGRSAMQQLIDHITRHSCRQYDLEATLVGGGKIITGVTDIGQQNIDFARDYLQQCSIPIVAEHLGGEEPRSLLYRPTTGELRFS